MHSSLFDYLMLYLQFAFFRCVLFFCDTEKTNDFYIVRKKREEKNDKYKRHEANMHLKNEPF